MLTSTDSRGVVTATVYDNLDRRKELRETNTTGPLLGSSIYDTLRKGTITSSTKYVGSVVGTPGLAYTTSVGSYDDAYRPFSTTVSIPVGAPGIRWNHLHADPVVHARRIAEHHWTPGGMGAYPARACGTLYGYTGTVSGLRSGTYNYLGTVAYSPIGQLAQLNRPGTSSTISSYGYDAATGLILALNDVTLSGGSYVNVASRTYTRDLAGNVTSSTTTATGATTNTQCYTYDYLQNLTAAWTPTSNSCSAAPTSSTIGGPAPYWTTYSVDPVTGNRTQVVNQPTTSGGVATTRKAPTRSRPDRARTRCRQCRTKSAPARSTSTATPTTSPTAGAGQGKSSPTTRSASSARRPWAQTPRTTSTTPAATSSSESTPSPEPPCTSA